MAEKSPCYLPGSSKALTTTQIMATKHKQQTPANTTTQKTIVPLSLPKIPRNLSSTTKYTSSGHEFLFALLPFIF